VLIVEGLPHLAVERFGEGKVGGQHRHTPFRPRMGKRMGQQTDGCPLRYAQCSETSSGSLSGVQADPIFTILRDRSRRVRRKNRIGCKGADVARQTGPVQAHFLMGERAVIAYNKAHGI
jgi:hypothetical protein